MARLSILEHFEMGFPVGSLGVLAVLELFLDDTGTHTGSRVAGVGGLIGTKAAWDDFNSRWSALLACPLDGKPPLEKWSSNDCRWGVNEFTGYNEAERDRVTCLFRDVITQSNLFSIANMVDRDAREILVERLGPEPEQTETGEGIALYRAMTRLQGWAHLQPGGPQIAVFYDLGRMNSPAISRLASLVNAPDTKLEHIEGFAFARVAKSTPLQAADMIATESFWYAGEFLKYGKSAKQRPHFAAYWRDNPNKGNGEILDHDAIKNMRMTQLTGSSASFYSQSLS